MGEQGFMHITQQLMQVPPDDSATSLHATCSFKLQHSCNFSYLLPSHVSWSSLNLTSPMLKFDKIWLAMHNPVFSMHGSELAEHGQHVDWHDSQLQLLECATPASALFCQSVLEANIAPDIELCLLTTYVSQLWCGVDFSWRVAVSTQAAQQFAEGVKQIDGLEVVGKPDMCLVAIKSTSKKLNIYKVNDLMSQRGWHLNALQFPSSVHMCFTAQHTEVVPELLKVATLNLPSNALHVYTQLMSHMNLLYMARYAIHQCW